MCSSDLSFDVDLHLVFSSDAALPKFTAGMCLHRCSYTVEHNAAQLSSAVCMFNYVIVTIDYGGIAYGITHVLLRVISLYTAWVLGASS